MPSQSRHGCELCRAPLLSILLVQLTMFAIEATYFTTHYLNQSPVGFDAGSPLGVSVQAVLGIRG